MKFKTREEYNRIFDILGKFTAIIAFTLYTGYFILYLKEASFFIDLDVFKIIMYVISFITIGMNVLEAITDDEHKPYLFVFTVTLVMSVIFLSLI